MNYNLVYLSRCLLLHKIHRLTHIKADNMSTLPQSHDPFNIYSVEEETIYRHHRRLLTLW